MVNFSSISTHALQNAVSNAHELLKNNLDQYHQLSGKCTRKVLLELSFHTTLPDQKLRGSTCLLFSVLTKLTLKKHSFDNATFSAAGDSSKPLKRIHCRSLAINASLKPKAIDMSLHEADYTCEDSELNRFSITRHWEDLSTFSSPFPSSAPHKTSLAQAHPTAIPVPEKSLQLSKYPIRSRFIRRTITPISLLYQKLNQ